MLFHISEKEKFSFGLGNIENLNKVSQQLNIKIPDITIITNGNAILEYFNNETVALMKNAVDNYKTSIKCCKVALTGNLIEMGKCKNDPNTIEQCVDNVIANDMPKFVNVVPAGIVFINENYAKFRYFKP